MRILAIYRHYWPDATPYARLLRAILEDQTTQGRETTVFTAQPGYNDIEYTQQLSQETLGGVDIRRISLLPERKHWRFLRVINYFYYLIRAVLHVVFFRRYDVIIANTHPPILIGIALRVISSLTKTPYVLHCQDIHPESALIAGHLKEGWLARLLLSSDSKSCLAAKQIVTLSSEMKQTLTNRAGVNDAKIKVINNFPLDIYQKAEGLPEVFTDQTPNVYRVLFAGNMGVFQELDRLVEAAKLLRNKRDLRFIFMGTGSELTRLKKLAGEQLGKSIFFEPFQPADIAYACMKHADLGVISLREGICKVAYPSKTMTYLAAGCPLIALTDRDSELANDIEHHRLGYTPIDLTPVGIANAIEKAMLQRGDWTDATRDGLVLRSDKLFGRQLAISAWRDLFNDLENGLLNNNCDSEENISDTQKIAA